LNSATGSKVENADDRELADRKRGMKLVSRNAKGGAFRIELADDLFAKSCPPEHAPETAPRDFAAIADNAKASLECSSDSPTVGSSSREMTFVLVVATAAGLIIGYLAGRRRD
jgi:hypothetical protein